MNIVYVFFEDETLKDKHSLSVKVLTCWKNYNATESKSGNYKIKFLEIIIKLCVIKHTFV